jgi:N-acetylmuramoyl-L-alanine amidase
MFECCKPKKPELRRPRRDPAFSSSWEKLIFHAQSERSHLATLSNGDTFAPNEGQRLAAMAQWILESGRGSSQLAKQHLNFAGLKYRPEMKKYASPVEYEAWDGWDTYCKFESVEDFIKGFWVFLHRDPYKAGNWQARTIPESYLRSIVPPYTTPAESYIQKCLRLLPEAQELLDRDFDAQSVPELPAEDENFPRLAVVVGHTARAKGAWTTYGVSEFDYNTKIAKLMEHRDHKFGLDVKVFYRPGTDGRREAYRAVRDWGADMQIELHFNAANGVATGTETLSSFDSKDVAYAQTVQDYVCDLLKRGDNSRGVKKRTRGSRASTNVYGYPSNPITIPNCLPEPAFGDVESDAALLKGYQDQLATVYLKASSDFWLKHMET